MPVEEHTRIFPRPTVVLSPTDVLRPTFVLRLTDVPRLTIGVRPTVEPLPRHVQAGFTKSDDLDEEKEVAGADKLVVKPTM